MIKTLFALDWYYAGFWKYPTAITQSMRFAFLIFIFLISGGSYGP